MKFLIALLAVTVTALVSAQSDTADAAVDQPTQEYLPPPTTAEDESAKLTDDGYRYKTVRKLKYRARRHRRDVNQEYLPPLSEPLQEYLPPANALQKEDGYRYKTVRKLKYRARHRRDVSQEYLPPVSEPLQEYLPPVEQQADAQLHNDGYRYKSVRKLKIRSRHRRDIADIEKPANDYLPPVEVELAPSLQSILGDDGYRYRAIKRLKYRRHRREAEAAADVPAGDYLPPAEEIKESAEETNESTAAAEPKSADLAEDGYRYKTVRRIRYRHRH